MSNRDPIMNCGDPVYYTGNKQSIKAMLVSKEGKPLKGWIHSKVRDNPRAFVVEFPEAKESDYIMSVDVLAHWRAPKEKEKYAGPEIQPRRKRTVEE